MVVTSPCNPPSRERHHLRAAASGPLAKRWEQRVNSIVWAVIVATGWFVLNLIGTLVNRSIRFISLEQAGDVPIPASSSRPALRLRRDTRTSGSLTILSPRWLGPAARALNNMRAQAPYLAAVMALAWWIERMWP